VGFEISPSLSRPALQQLSYFFILYLVDYGKEQGGNLNFPISLKRSSSENVTKCVFEYYLILDGRRGGG
jgi:hypothetical protein